MKAGGEKSDRAAPQAEDRGHTPEGERQEGQPGVLVRQSPSAAGVPPEIARAQMLFLQRTAGNRAAQSLLSPKRMTVQRKPPSLSG
jgi:hypothetical protein